MIEYIQKNIIKRTHMPLRNLADFLDFLINETDQSKNVFLLKTRELINDKSILKTQGNNVNRNKYHSLI